MKAVFSPSFKRSLRSIFKKHPDLRDTFWRKVKLFQESPFHPSLKNHTLGGTLEGLRAFSINKDIRVVFRFTPDGNAIFTDLGDHDEVY